MLWVFADSIFKVLFWVVIVTFIISFVTRIHSPKWIGVLEFFVLGAGHLATRRYIFGPILIFLALFAAASVSEGLFIYSEEPVNLTQVRYIAIIVYFVVSIISAIFAYLYAKDEIYYRRIDKEQKVFTKLFERMNYGDEKAKREYYRLSFKKADPHLLNEEIERLVDSITKKKHSVPLRVQPAATFIGTTAYQSYDPIDEYEEVNYKKVLADEAEENTQAIIDFEEEMDRLVMEQNQRDIEEMQRQQDEIFYDQLNEDPYADHHDNANDYYDNHDNHSYHDDF